MLKILLSFIILFSLDVSARGGHYKNHRKVVKLKVDKKKCTSPCEVKLSAKLNRHNNKNIKEFLFNFGDGNKVTSTESSVLHTYRHTYKELPKFEWRSGNYWREFFRYLKYRLIKRRTEFKWMRPTLEVVYNKGHNSRKSSQRIRIKGELLTDVKPPVLASIQNFEVNEDEILSFTLKGAEGGEEGDLSYSLVDSPANGTLSECLSNSDDLTCKFTPSANFNGEVSFSYKANDGKSDSNIGEVKIDIRAVNDFPELIANQSFSGSEDEAIIFSLQAATDIDSSSLTYSLAASPSNGVLTGCFASNSLECTFTPNANFNGEVEFSYRANDGEGTSAPSVVKLTVNAKNDAPTLITSQSFTAKEDTDLVINFAAATDIDSSNLTYSLVSSVDNATLSNCFDSKGLNCSVKFEKDFNGVVSFQVKANDGELDSNISTVSITVAPINDAPVIASELIISTDEDVAISVDLKNASDIDSSELSYKLISTPVEVTVTGCTKADDYICTLTPALNFNGNLELTYSANDGELDSNIQKINLTVLSVNDAPVAVIGYQNGADAGVIKFSATSSTDIEGSIASYEWDFGNGKKSTEPVIDHKYEASGNYTVILKVTDSDGLSSTVEEKIDVEVALEDIYILGKDSITVIQHSEVFDRFDIVINNQELYDADKLELALSEKYDGLELLSDGSLDITKTENLDLLPDNLIVNILDEDKKVVKSKTVSIKKVVSREIAQIPVGNTGEYTISNVNSKYNGTVLELGAGVVFNQPIKIHESNSEDGTYELTVGNLGGQKFDYAIKKLPTNLTPWIEIDPRYSSKVLGLGPYSIKVAIVAGGAIALFGDALLNDAGELLFAGSCFLSPVVTKIKSKIDTLSYATGLKKIKGIEFNAFADEPVSITNNKLTSSIQVIQNNLSSFKDITFIFYKSGSSFQKLGGEGTAFVNPKVKNTAFVNIDKLSASGHPYGLLLHEVRHIEQDNAAGCVKANRENTVRTVLREADAERFVISHPTINATDYLVETRVLNYYKSKYGDFLKDMFKGKNSYLHGSASSFIAENDTSSKLRGTPASYFAPHLWDFLPDKDNPIATLNSFERGDNYKTVIDFIEDKYGKEGLFTFLDKMNRGLLNPTKKFAPISHEYDEAYKWKGPEEEVKKTYWKSSGARKNYVYKGKDSPNGKIVTLDYNSILLKYGIIEEDYTDAEKEEELAEIQLLVRVLNYSDSGIPYMSIGGPDPSTATILNKPESGAEVYTEFVELDMFNPAPLPLPAISISRSISSAIVPPLSSGKALLYFGYNSPDVEEDFDIEVYPITQKQFCNINTENELKVSIQGPTVLEFPDYDKFGDPLENTFKLTDNEPCKTINFAIGRTMYMQIEGNGGKHYGLTCSGPECLAHSITSDEGGNFSKFEISSQRKFCDEFGGVHDSNNAEKERGECIIFTVESEDLNPDFSRDQFILH